jgi:glycosyltransferase involved in cell wall biosynthesis
MSGLFKEKWNMQYNNPVLSIIIPVYNVQKYLSKCIDSILTQTFRNFELILINDGSDDGSAEICKQYERKDKRIKYINKNNGGVSSARNLGLKLAIGEYIGFVDGDDWIEVDMYEKLIDFIKIKQADIAVGGYIKNYGDKTEMMFCKGTATIFDSIKGLINMLEQVYFGWEIVDKIYKRDLFKNIFFNENSYVCEDLLMMWYLFKKSKIIAYIPLYKYHYFYRTDSVTNSGFSLKNLSGIPIKKKIHEEARKMSPALLDLSLRIYVAELVIVCRKMMLNNGDNKKEIMQFQREIRKNIRCAIKPKALTLRQRIGIIFFSLPYCCCNKLSAFL